ncbi:ribonucleoside diphosreductase [Escherichia coli]|nr:ribonucleoside diphosreductase [Escherichia coli]
MRRVSVASGTECRKRRERLIRPTVLGLDLVGLIRGVSVASGTECRMRRERLIRPTVLGLDLVGLIRRVSVASGKKRQRTQQTQPHLASNL